MIKYQKGGTQKDIYEKSEVLLVPCPFCKESEYENIYKERGALGIVRCLKCRLIYVNPRLKSPEKVYWGDSDKYIREAKLIFEDKASHHRDPNYLQDLKLIDYYKPKGNFLDVGTNMGFFLRNAKKINPEWRLYGVEPSPSLSNIAKEHFGLNIKTALLEEAGFEDNFFDIISMTDVFEHISDPKTILKESRRILKPEGILFIKVPNGMFNLFKYYVAKKLNRLKNYDIFDSYEHVVHYSGQTLKAMLSNNGFNILKMTIGKPIQIPVWHNYVGQYYQYPSPWGLDFKRQTARTLVYWFSLIEFLLKGLNIGYLAPNIIVVAQKNDS